MSKKFLGAETPVAPTIAGVDARDVDRRGDRGDPVAVAGDHGRDHMKAPADMRELEMADLEAHRGALRVDFPVPGGTSVTGVASEGVVMWRFSAGRADAPREARHKKSAAFC